MFPFIKYNLHEHLNSHGASKCHEASWLDHLLSWSMVNLIHNDSKTMTQAVRQWIGKEILHVQLRSLLVKTGLFFRLYILSNENGLNSSQCNYILGKTSSAWDLLAHTSGKLNHINVAGRQVGTLPEQSGQNERKITRKRGIPLAWIIATQHFDQLCDNFHTIWQLSAGWNGEKQWFRSFPGTWKLYAYLSLIPMCLKAATTEAGRYNRT